MQYGTSTVLKGIISDDLDETSVEQAQWFSGEEEADLTYKLNYRLACDGEAAKENKTRARRVILVSIDTLIV
ncbi:hypothetical protein V6N13_107525 [Hibiscus sabdariffa]|uniref:Uncharacterized protein n=1 Tax=Hibiscus sabdariffa TaxID=183260 RepID=A0ABR2SQC6_9ROSI